MKLWQDAAEILNGRPCTSSGPPVGLYHSVFDLFFEYFNESTLEYRTAPSANSDDSTSSTDDAFGFMRASSAFYNVEQSLRVREFFKWSSGSQILNISPSCEKCGWNG